MTDTNPYEDDAPVSPENLTSTTRTAVVEGNTLTVNVEMKRGTDFSKESKTVSTYIKVALPDGAVVSAGDIAFGVTDKFRSSVDETARDLLNLAEVAAARQHGLDYQADDAGVIRVLNLFPGATAGPAPKVQPGAFTPPPAAAVAAPAPLPGTPAGNPVPAGNPNPFPGAPVAGAFPAPGAAPVAPAAPQGFQGGGNSFQPTKSDNPAKWSFYDEVGQATLAAVVEAWVIGGGVGPEVVNKMTPDARYPGVTVNGVDIGGKTLKGNRLFGQQTKAWVQNLVNSGLNLG